MMLLNSDLGDFRLGGCLGCAASGCDFAVNNPIINSECRISEIVNQVRVPQSRNQCASLGSAMKSPGVGARSILSTVKFTINPSSFGSGERVEHMGCA